MDNNTNGNTNKEPYPSVLTVANVRSLNVNSTPLMDDHNIFLSEFLCKSEDEDEEDNNGDLGKESTTNNEFIIAKSAEEPKASTSLSDNGLGPSNNDVEKIQVRIPPVEMVDIEESSSNDSIMNDLSATNQAICDGTFFALNKAKTIKLKVLVANCKLCRPTKEIRETWGITSNFRAHLKREHGHLTNVQLDLHIRSKKARLEEIQNCLPPPSAPPSTAPTPTAEAAMEFNTNVLNFVLKSFTSLSAVETPEFWAMFNHSNVIMPRISKEHLTTQIESKFKLIKDKIITMLEGVDFVCITTDMWSSKCHSYVAITCHWIDRVTYKRNSVALSCKRFDCNPDLLNTEEHLKKVLKNYNLPRSKITSNITKNFYNFAKLYKKLNIPTIACDIISENNVFPFDQTSDLMPNICYTKTLSLIATIDIPLIIDSRLSLRNIHESTLEKVFSFLCKAPSDATLGPMFVNYKKPDIVKWNTIYDSMVYFLRLEEKRPFAEMFAILKMQPLAIAELGYLRDYVKLLRPLALAFERLQCEQGTYHGYILPTLLEFNKKCESLEKCKVLNLCKPIAKTILIKCLMRFNDFFKKSSLFDSTTIASISHPFIKERWVSAISGIQKDTVRTIFIENVKNENSKLNGDVATNVDEEDESEQQIDDFYFGEEQQPTVHTKAKQSVELEAIRYLGDDRRNLKMLDDYPAVKRVFLKYNTCLSSSEPVEKLFPFEIRQNIARFGCLADELFEERVLLIVNKHVLAS